MFNYKVMIKEGISFNFIMKFLLNKWKISLLVLKIKKKSFYFYIRNAKSPSITQVNHLKPLKEMIPDLIKENNTKK